MNKPKIFCDHHHEQLYYSLHLLFEKRLGYELYRPIHMNWFHEGFWKIQPFVETAHQYLGLDTKENWDQLRANTQNQHNYHNEHSVEVEPGIFHTPDHPRNTSYKSITLNKFKEMKFDIVLSSIPEHVVPFKLLCDKFMPEAKQIFQAGNNWHLPHLPIKNVLNSAKNTIFPPQALVINYHQEFDLSFNDDNKDPHRIMSMLHYMKPEPKQLFEATEALMPNYCWKQFGVGNRDNKVETNNIYDEFNKAGWLYHIKSDSDGFGYNIHMAAASGTPIITDLTHYRGTTAEKLLIPNITCIDAHGMSPTQLAEAIMNSDHSKMSAAIKHLFKRWINYDAEEQQIRSFTRILK